jgi:hypothetical protein
VLLRLFFCAVVVALATGCGAGEPKQRRAASPQRRDCKSAGHGYSICGYPTAAVSRRFSTIELAARQIAGPIEKTPDGHPVGHWERLWLSPDGRTLLAQWIAECEVPIAFFIPAGGGKPRAVTGDRDWRNAPESVARGWTRDGRARVLLPRGACGGSFRIPGVYLIDPRGGEPTLVKRVKARLGGA